MKFLFLGAKYMKFNIDKVLQSMPHGLNLKQN